MICKNQRGDWSRERHFGITVLVAALLASGCDNTLTEFGTPAQTSRERSNSQYVNLDAEFDRLVDIIPGGFGGWTVEDGVTIVFLQDLTRSAEVEIILPQILLHRRMPPSYRITQVRYNVRQLLEWRTALDRQLSGPGIIFSDASETANKVMIGVENDLVGSSVRSKAELIGIPPDAVVAVVTQRPRQIADIRYYNRPVTGGLNLGTLPGGTCTIGYNIERPSWHDDAGLRFFTTATHCGNDFEVDGELHYQPWYDPDYYYIGLEYLDPPLNTSGCPNSLDCRYADVAMIEYHDSVSWSLGRIARPVNNTGSFTIDQFIQHSK